MLVTSGSLDPEYLPRHGSHAKLSKVKHSHKTMNKDIKKHKKRLSYPVFSWGSQKKSERQKWQGKVQQTLEFFIEHLQSQTGLIGPCLGTENWCGLSWWFTGEEANDPTLNLLRADLCWPKVLQRSYIRLQQNVPEVRKTKSHQPHPFFGLGGFNIRPCL